MSSATCRTRRSWPSPGCCWARTTVRRQRCCGATLSGLSPMDVPTDIVADWRADLPDLCPAVLAFSERRRRRTRDRSRKGDDLRRVFELAATSDVDPPERAIAI